MTDGTYAETVPVLEAECPQVWLARRLAAGRPAEVWVPVPGWYYEQLGLPVPASPHQVSDQGRIRNAKGAVLSDRPNGRPKELPPEEQYRRTNLCGGGKRAPVLIHHVVLAGFHPEARGDRVTRHLGRGDANRAWNWYPEGVTWGTPEENAQDISPEVRVASARTARATQMAAGIAMGPPPPTHECVNYARCGGKALNKGRRCDACVARVGVDAAALLNAGMRLQDVAEHFGYTADNWTYKLAIEHGGYTGSKPEARMQHPTLRQRVRLIWLRRHTEGVAQRD
jgi:hypothetical protein